MPRPIGGFAAGYVTPVPSSGAAIGSWTPRDVYANRLAGTWPVVGTTGPQYTAANYTRLWGVTTKTTGRVTGSATTVNGAYAVKWWDGTTTMYSSGATFSRQAAGGQREFEIYPAAYVLTEESSNAFIGANYGTNAQISTAQKKFGSSSYYTSGTDFLNVKTTGSEFDFGAGNFTVEFWFKCETNLGFNEQAIVTSGYPVDATGFWIGMTGGGNLRVLVGDGGWIVDRYPANSNVSSGAWFHIALVRNGNEFKIYRDGTAVDTFTVTQTLNNINRAICIGGRSVGYPTQICKGWIDGFRVVKGTAVYTANFTAPTTAPTAITNTVLLLNFESGFSTDYADKTTATTALLLNFNGTNNATTTTDASTNNHTLTFSGNAKISTTQSKFGGSSLYLDGTGDYLTTSTSTAFDFSRDFTVECWIYPTQSAAIKTILHINAGGTRGLHVYQNGTSLCVDNGETADYTGTNLLTANAWQHIAITQCGDQLNVFVGGTRATSRRAQSYKAPDRIQIGRFYNGGVVGDFEGYIDDVRFIAGVALYKTSFTAPAAQLAIYGPTTVYNGVFNSFDVSNNALTQLRADNVWINQAPGSWFGTSVWLGYPYYYWQWQQQYAAGAKEAGYLGYNSLSATALDQFYTDLKSGTGDLFVAGNTGVNSDTPTTASDKGYTVFGSTAPTTSLLLNFNGTNNATTTTDSSSNNFALTFNGNAKISTDQSKFGGSSLYLDGTGDYLSRSTGNIAFEMGTGDFTVECWVRFNALPAANAIAGFCNPTANLNSAGSDIWWFGFYNVSGGRLYLGQHATSNSAYCSWAPATNQWYHVAYTRASGVSRLFINGVSQTVTNPTIFSTTVWYQSGFVVGAITSPAYLNGYIDDFRLVKGAALYLDSFTPPSAQLAVYP